MKPKKIILVIIDTLRADHLGCYGYKRNTSPNIDILAKESFVFKHAFSPSSLSIPSIASILTSKYPGNHSMGFNPEGKLDQNNDVTLTSILCKKNYKTAAFVSSKKLAKNTNLNAGFELFDDEKGFDKNGRRDCLTTNSQVINWLEEHYDNNFFLFVHYFNTHGPYVTNELYKYEFVNDEFYGEPEYIRDNFDINPAFNSIPGYKILKPIKNETDNLLDYKKDVNYYKAQYDGCIKHIDDIFGTLVQKLKELEIYDDCQIIVTSNHGEAFGENNVFFNHGLTVTLEQTSVPLLLKPHIDHKMKTMLIDTPVSTIDIMPTVLSLCGHDYSSLRIEGYSLVKILANEVDPLLKYRTLVSENEGQFALIQPGGLMELKKKDNLVSSYHSHMPALIELLNGKKFYWNSGDEYLLNIPFDQYQRYKIIADIIHKFRINEEKFKILDVGASFEGNLKKFLPHDEIYFLDKEYPAEYEKKNNYITGDVTKIELNDTYDFVVSIDTYEHINPISREEFIKRLLNISIKATIIAAPFDTPGVREHEIFANEVFKISHGIEYNWLHEHIQNGLPSLPFTLEMIKSSGFNPEVIPNGYLSRWLEMISIYLLTEGMQEFSKNMEELNDFYNNNFYYYDNLDPAYRHVIIINKTNQNIDFSDIKSQLSELDPDFGSKSEMLKSIIKESKELCGNFRYKELLEKKGQVVELTNKIIELNNDMQSKDMQIINLDAQLQSMQQSIVWRLLMWYHKNIVERALPQGTRRKELYNTTLKGGRIIVNEGFWSLWRKLNDFNGNPLIAFLMHIENSIKKSDPKLMQEWKNKISTMKNTSKIILFVDRHIPTYDKDAGSYIIYEYLNLLAKLDYNIIFWPYDLRDIEPYSDDIKKNNIEIVTGNISYYEFLHEFGKQIEYIFLSRPSIAHEYIGISKKFSNAKKIYIGHDLHYLREKRGEDVTLINSSYKNTKKIEANIMLNADISLFFSDKEVEIINHEFEGINAKVMPWIQELHMDEIVLNSERKEILFLGGFKHLPNLDAMLWFKDEIFPLVKKAIPFAHVTIIGSDPTEELLKMENDNCTITGYVEESELSDIFKKARVFIAPLRYGAGFKGKIAKAMSFGVPVVTTTIGSEGIGLEDGKTAMITDNPGEFAENIINLYKEDSLWKNISSNAAEHLINNFSFENAKRKIKEFLI